MGRNQVFGFLITLTLQKTDANQLLNDTGTGRRRSQTFALRLAAACTTGGTLPGMKPIQPFQVIYQTAEDGLGDTVKPRLIEAAADLDRVLEMCIRDRG